MSFIKNCLPAIVDERTKVLIVGSMPGVKSLEKQQYYGNLQNHFWRIIEKILSVEMPTDYVERLQVLSTHHIGVWDVIKYCERVGSLDAKIKNEVPNDFEALFKTYPNIELVVFNGTKAYDVFRKKVGLHLLEERTWLKMPSTSPIPGKNIKSFDEKVELWGAIRPYLK